MKNILLVEDEFIIARMIENHLENMGFTSNQIAMSGEQALEAFEKDNFDLLLVDIKLNGELDGIETVERIRLQSPVPIIYLSGNSDQQTFERSKKTQPVDYLLKPIKMDKLQESIQKALGVGKK
ncbi:MAG: response regulator [Balneolales bacterium]